LVERCIEPAAVDRGAAGKCAAVVRRGIKRPDAIERRAHSVLRSGQRRRSKVRCSASAGSEPARFDGLVPYGHVR
jgi:hypothetical protein